MILSINKKGNFESIQIKAQFSLQADKSLCCTPQALYMKTKRALSCWVQSVSGVLQWTDSWESAQARSCRQSVPRVPGWGAASQATSCQVSQHFSWRCCWSTGNAGWLLILSSSGQLSFLLQLNPLTKRPLPEKRPHSLKRDHPHFKEHFSCTYKEDPWQKTSLKRDYPYF